jgi:hypothetical protein
MAEVMIKAFKPIDVIWFQAKFTFTTLYIKGNCVSTTVSRL